MKLIADFFIRNAKLTIVISALIGVFGIQGIIRMNAESFPAVDFAMATIETFYSGASAVDIEAKITKPIEDEIKSVSGVKDIRSISQPGRSFIFVRADIDNVNVEQVMNDLQKAVDRVSNLPKDLENAPKFSELKSEEFPVMQIAVLGSNKNRFRDLVSDELKTEIEDNKNVLKVDLMGHRKRQFVIHLDKKKMELFHIGVSEVISKIKLRNINVPGGSLKDAVIQKLVRIEGKIKNKNELDNILIRSNFSGRQIFLKDIALVEDGMEDGLVLSRYNGKPATMAIVTKKAGVDTIDLAKNVEKKLNIFKKKYNDKLKFVVFHNEADKVTKRLGILESNALWGFFFVIFFLFVFLPIRIGLAASLSLPLIILGTFGIMNAWGMNLDTVSILALVIALGMMVDNSVVISENYTRLRQNNLYPKDAALTTIKNLWAPITATAFTTIAAFLPMLVTRGIMGEFIKFIPIIVTSALLLSLIESFFLLPTRLTNIASKIQLQKNKTGKTSTHWFQKHIASNFEKMMGYLINRRYLVFLGFIGILVISWFFMRMTPFNLFPKKQTEIYFARIEMPKGTRLEVTYDKLEDLSSAISNTLGNKIKYIMGKAGTSENKLGDSKGKDGNNQGALILYVSDYAKYNIPYSKILKKLETIRIDGITNISFEAAVHGPPVGDPINATFRSNNNESMETMLKKVVGELGKIDGIYDLKVKNVVGNNEIFVNIDFKKADRLGLAVKQIGDAVSAAVSGKIVSNVTLDNKKIDLMLRLQGDYKKNLSDLKKLLIMNKQGNLVPLSKVADFTERPGAPHIFRYDFKRSKTLTGNVNQKFITSRKANKHLLKIFNKFSNEHSDVSIVFGGEEENTKDSMQSLLDALLLSLICIFGLLVFIFGSFLRPFIIMTTIPLGLFGFSIAFYFHDEPRSFLALIGLIGLGGIIVNSGIVLISFIEQMKRETTFSLHEILAKASSVRLRAVVVTSLTTVAGLMPTAYGIGGKDATLIPMTLAMAWGLTSGTVFTLIWIPCAYAINEDIVNFFKRIWLAMFPSATLPDMDYYPPDQENETSNSGMKQ
ncbi:MAG: efflux RND transporter permease subunit [Bacteriovoracaceae bacterium]|nr:efflux RND transporter permease subunit [Bacteriovoracaceae bacterium]